MRDARGVNDSRGFQFDVLGPEVIKQADAGTEQHRHDVELDLVEQPGSKALLRDARTHQADVLVTCLRLCLLYGALYPVCDKGVRDLSLWHDIRDGVRQHEQRNTGKRSVPTLGVRDVVGRPPSHDRPGALDQLFEHLSAAAGELEGRH